MSDLVATYIGQRARLFRLQARRQRLVDDVSAEEDNVLEAMDDTWNKMTDAEHNEIRRLSEAHRGQHVAR